MAMADRAQSGETRASEPSGNERFEPWPWVLALMVVTMMGISISLWVVAASNPDALVGDAWETGLAFNDEFASRQAAAAQGATLEASSVATREGARVRAQISGASPQRVTVERIRPAEAGWDSEIPLRLLDGAWTADVALPQPGRWRFRVRADFAETHLERVIDVWHAGNER